MTEKKLNIAVFSDSFFPSVDGVVTSISNTALELSKRGHQIVVFAPKPKDFFQVPKITGFEVVWVRSVPLLSYQQYRVSPPFSFTVQKKLVQFKPDVIHCHTPFSLGWMGISLAKKLRVPVVATYHTLLPDFLMYAPLPVLNKTRFLKNVTWAYTNFFYNKADLVTTPTRAMAKELKRHGCKAISISNPIHFSLFNQFAKTKKPNPKKEFRMVYFGRISFEKNIEVVLQALKILATGKTKIPAKLFLIGDGPAKPFLQKTARELAIEKKIEFTGVLRGKTLAKKIATCHVMVTASTIETQGLTVLEAMAAGLPVVGTDFLGIPDALKENKNGFLFKPFEAQTAAKKIRKLFDSGSLYQRLSVESMKTARAYSVETVCGQWEKVYQKLAKTTRIC